MIITYSVIYGCANNCANNWLNIGMDDNFSCVVTYSFSSSPLNRHSKFDSRLLLIVTLQINALLMLDRCYFINMCKCRPTTFAVYVMIMSVLVACWNSWESCHVADRLHICQFCLFIFCVLIYACFTSLQLSQVWLAWKSCCLSNVGGPLAGLKLHNLFGNNLINLNKIWHWMSRRAI